MIGSLWNFKRDEIEGDADITINNASSFKYKANLIGNTENNGLKNVVKIAIPLKYLQNFWRSLEMPLIVKLNFRWDGMKNVYYLMQELLQLLK